MGIYAPHFQSCAPYAELAEKTLLIDPSLPNSNITIKSGKGQKFTKEECLETISAALEMNGIHLEPCGEKVIRVFPSKVALQNGIPIITSPKPLEEKGRIVSMMIPFKNISVEEAEEIKKKLVDAGATVEIK